MGYPRWDTPHRYHRSFNRRNSFNRRRQSSKTSLETPSSPRLLSSIHHAFLSFLTRNGPTSSQARQLTSIMSSQRNIRSPMTNDELSKLVISNSLSSQLSQREWLIHTGNGLLPGTKQLMPHRTCSRTDLQSCETIIGTSRNSLPVPLTHCTRASFNLIKLSTSAFHNDGTCCSLTTISSLTSTSSGSKMLEPGSSLESQRSRDIQVCLEEVANAGKHVGDGTRDGALTQTPTLTSHMSAQNVADNEPIVWVVN